MTSLVVAALAALSAGFLIRALDRRRSRYGVFLLPGVCVATAMVLWVFLQLGGTGSDPDFYWLAWALPPCAGAAAAAVTALAVAPRRESRDTAELERVLRL